MNAGTGYADWAYRNDDSYFQTGESTPMRRRDHWRQLDSYFRDCRCVDYTRSRDIRRLMPLRCCHAGMDKLGLVSIGSTRAEVTIQYMRMQCNVAAV